MEPIVSVIMGSTSDLPVMEKALAFLNEQQIPFEVNALSAHRTPDDVEVFARSAEERGIKVIIAAAGMAAALPGVIAASTTVPVIGVPIKGMLDGLDAMLSIIQMPPGIPVATAGLKCTSATRGVMMPSAFSCADMLAIFSASRVPCVVSLTSSPPAAMMRLACATQASVSLVLVVVIDCTLTGLSPPMAVCPTLATLLRRRT